MKGKIRFTVGMIIVAAVMVIGSLKSEAYTVKLEKDGCAYEQITPTAYLIVNRRSESVALKDVYTDGGIQVGAASQTMSIIGSGKITDEAYLKAVQDVIDEVKKASASDSKVKSISNISIDSKIENIPKKAFSSDFLTGIISSQTYVNFITDANGNTALKAIGDFAFDGGTLKYINLPESVESIGNSVFYNCVSLETVRLSSKIAKISDDAFYECQSLTRIDLPKGIKEIGARSFYDCCSINYIDFPEGLESIGVNAFTKCGLKSACLPNSLITLGNGAFYNSQIREVSFGNSLKNISGGCFSNCNWLKRVNWGKSIETISDTAFKESTKLLEDLVLPDTIKEIGEMAFGSIHEELLAQMPQLVIPEGTIKVGDRAFINIVIDELTLPASITDIGGAAFELGENAKVKYTGTEEQFQKIDFHENEVFTNKTPIILTPPQKKYTYRITALTLDKDFYYYDTKVHAPIATVNSGNIVLLKGYTSTSENVKLVNDATNYLPGTYKVSATGIGDGEGSLETAYTIAVKPVTIKNIKVAKTSMTISVKKLASKYVTGYEARYGTSKNMNKAKTVTIGKTYKATSKKVTKLKKNKKYYVQVRSYVKVGKKNYYSDWSEIKTVKTKK